MSPVKKGYCMLAEMGVTDFRVIEVAAASRLLIARKAS